MSTLSEFHAGLTVGSVESVGPGLLTVVLSSDAPHGTALNTGALTRFPRLNGYVVIPSEAGATLGLVTWLGTEPDRSHIAGQEPDLVDLALPRRRVRVLPLGTVSTESAGGARLVRGVLAFPTVGDPVLLPTAPQLEALVLPETPDHIRLGVSPLAGSAAVRVDPDRMLARHLAILGNTGSGKSCTAAIFLRRALQTSRPAGSVGPRVLILDANGEYQNTFDDLEGLTVRRFSVDPTDGAERLRVPAWLWTSREWVAFAGAQRAAQAPFLRQALRLLRRGGALTDPELARVVTTCRSYHVHVRRRAVQTAHQAEFRERMDAGNFVDLMIKSIGHYHSTIADEGLKQRLAAVMVACERAKESCFSGKYWSSIDVGTWEAIAEPLDALLADVEVDASSSTVHEDDPVFFFVDDLAAAIDLAALEDESGGSVHQWIAPLVFRLHHVLNDRRLRSIAESDPDESLTDILDRYLAPNQVSIIDLSLVPSTARSVILSVLTRLMFDAHERYRRAHGETSPSVLVMEEAHAFIARSRAQSDDQFPATPADLCREAFERIAREGRKFGLSLVLTSQRPAELSETVLSQCNTFLIHRVVNDVDQALLRRLVPDALGDLLAELPSLPARSAILLGWASEIPTLLLVDELEKRFRPKSDDPQFLRHWRSQGPSRGWSTVADQWQRDWGDSLSQAIEPKDASTARGEQHGPGAD